MFDWEETEQQIRDVRERFCLLVGLRMSGCRQYMRRTTEHREADMQQNRGIVLAKTYKIIRNFFFFTVHIKQSITSVQKLILTKQY